MASNSNSKSGLLTAGGVLSIIGGVLELIGGGIVVGIGIEIIICLLYTSPSPRDQRGSRMPSSA